MLHSSFLYNMPTPLQASPSGWHVYNWPFVAVLDSISKTDPLCTRHILHAFTSSLCLIQHMQASSRACTTGPCTVQPQVGSSSHACWLYTESHTYLTGFAEGAQAGYDCGLVKGALQLLAAQLPARDPRHLRVGCIALQVGHSQPPYQRRFRCRAHTGC